MRLSGIGTGEYSGFFAQGIAETYGAPIDMGYLSDAELQDILKRGAVRYRKLNPPKRDGWGFSDYVIAAGAIATAVYTGGAALGAWGAGAGAAGTAAAGAGAASTAAAGAGAASTAAAATAAGASTMSGFGAGSLWSMAQAAAPYVSSAGTAYGVVTGDLQTAGDIQAFANNIKNSDSFSAVTASTAEYLMKKDGIEIKDKEAKKALQELARRKQQIIAEQIEKGAEIEKQKKEKALDTLPIAAAVIGIPLLFVFMRE